MDRLRRVLLLVGVGLCVALVGSVTPWLLGYAFVVDLALLLVMVACMVVMVGFGALLWLVSARYWWWFWVWLAATVGFFATAWLYGLLFGWDT